MVAAALEEVEGPLELGPDVEVSVAAAFAAGCHDSNVGTDYFFFIILPSHHCSPFVLSLVPVVDFLLFTHIR